MEQLPPTNSAAWTPILVESFIRKVGEAATRARYVAAGGKNLKAIGWNWVLTELEGSGNLVNITQLQTKWKRLKTDYSDYDFLKGLSDRKRRSLEQNDEANKIRQASYDTMTGIKSSLDMLVRIYAAKNNLSDMIQDSI